VIVFDSQLLIGVASAAIGSVALVSGFRELARAVDSEDWPEVSGEIEETGVVTDSGGQSVTFAPEVRYHYRVGDSQYVSDRIAFGGRVSMTFRSWAEGIVARYRNSKTVKVRVCPTDPDLSVLEPGVHWSCWFVIVIATVVVAFGIRTLLIYFGVLD
jgi:Protein of unknown function (DUF3592)